METIETQGKTRLATSKNVPDLSSKVMMLGLRGGRQWQALLSDGAKRGRSRGGIDDWLVGDRYGGERWVQSGWLVLNQERKGKVT